MGSTIYIKTELKDILDKIRNSKQPRTKLSNLAQYYIVKFLLDNPEELLDIDPKEIEQIKQTLKELI